MKKHTILKYVTLFLSWLTLSPLLLILDGRWKLLPKWLRIVLFVLSPMMVLVVTAAIFFGYMYYSEHYMQHHFVKRRVVENITGVRLPRYKVLNQGEKGRRASRFPDRTYDFLHWNSIKCPTRPSIRILMSISIALNQANTAIAPSGATE